MLRVPLLPLSLAVAISTLSPSAAGPTAPRTAPPGAGLPAGSRPFDLPLRPTLTLDAARAALEGALSEARRLDAGGAIAVVDDGGHLVLLARIDGTFPASSEVAARKARTAATFRRPTRDFENAVRNGRHTLLAVDAMTPLEGGVPIVVAGQIVGAVGVSGAHSSEEDVLIAEAGASAVEN